MKRSRLFSGILAAVMSLSLTAVYPSGVHLQAAAVVSISPYSKSLINDGVFEGWGTSLCWWANRIGYSDSLSSQAAEMFFGDSGLRMNIARYNIGGGDDPSHDHITRTDSAMPGYTKYNNGNVTYDWSADASQRNVLLKSIGACKNDLIVEMFSNSPPYYMTKSGCTSGGTDPGKNNLRDDCYDDFADYLAKVCEHYQNTWGVKVQSVEAFNEPYTNFWSAYSAKQEGCHFDIGDSESKMITLLSDALSKYGQSDIAICGTDETSIDTQIDAFNALSQSAKNLISRIDTHTYGGSKRTALRDTALANNKNLWMSEVDGSGTAGTNAGQMGSALWLSERIMTDCKNLDCSAWVLWQAIDKHICAAGYNGKKDSGMPDTSGGFWGLAVADHDNNTIITTKKYYAFGQFSRYIRPGSVILRSADGTMAAYDEKNDQLVIVAMNTSGSNKDINFDLAQFSSIGSSVQAVRTSGSMTNGENWKELAPINTDGSGFTASLIPNSVTTYIIDDVTQAQLSNEIKITSDQVSGSAPWQNSANDCTKTVDGNLSSFFDGVGNGWVMIDLKNEYNLDSIAYAPRSGYEYRCVDASILVSSDGQNWEKVYTVPQAPTTGLNFITQQVTGKKVRYIRYEVPDGAPPAGSENKDSVYCCNIAEIKVYGVQAEDYPVGDINKDGSVNAADIMYLRDFLLGIRQFDDETFLCADLNNDSKVNVLDFCQLRNIFIKMM
ncbi:MAG: glycoside hydrolase [Oscillospiraceae bacterium]|nr:glycoside hydrolase [Oscillospiraceae bacterium]